MDVSKRKPASSSAALDSDLVLKRQTVLGVLATWRACRSPGRARAAHGDALNDLACILQHWSHTHVLPASGRVGASVSYAWHSSDVPWRMTGIPALIGAAVGAWISGAQHAQCTQHEDPPENLPATLHQSPIEARRQRTTELMKGVDFAPGGLPPSLPTVLSSPIRLITTVPVP